MVLQDAREANVDTLFVNAFSPEYGAFYRAIVPGTWTEPTLGEGDFLAKLVATADIRVVASFPLNRFNRYAADHPEMRVKTMRGAQYEPPLLSAYAPGFRPWLKEVLEECIERCPNLAGLEALETSVAMQLETERDATPDYHREATRLYQAKWPTEPLGGTKWREFRAAGITNLHRTLFDAAHSLRDGRAFVVQDLPTVAPCDPALMSLKDYMMRSGFDWASIARAGADFLVLQANWQQREAGCGMGVFIPAWVTHAIQQFVARVDNPQMVMAHVETTAFSSPAGPVRPNPAQFEESVHRAFEAPAGAVVYDYHQLKIGGLLPVLRGAFG